MIDVPVEAADRSNAEPACRGVAGADVAFMLGMDGGLGGTSEPGPRLNTTKNSLSWHDNALA